MSVSNWNGKGQFGVRYGKESKTVGSSKEELPVKWLQLIQLWRIIIVANITFAAIIASAFFSAQNGARGEWPFG